MRAKHFETVSQQLHHNFIITFIIISSSVRHELPHREAEFFFADWDSGRNNNILDLYQGMQAMFSGTTLSCIQVQICFLPIFASNFLLSLIFYGGGGGGGGGGVWQLSMTSFCLTV